MQSTRILRRILVAIALTALVAVTIHLAISDRKNQSASIGRFPDALQIASIVVDVFPGPGNDPPLHGISIPRTEYDDIVRLLTVTKRSKEVLWAHDLLATFYITLRDETQITIDCYWAGKGGMYYKFRENDLVMLANSGPPDYDDLGLHVVQIIRESVETKRLLN